MCWSGFISFHVWLLFRNSSLKGLLSALSWAATVFFVIIGTTTLGQRLYIGLRVVFWFSQNRYDAKKALLKDGTLLNGSLIVGVKPLDPAQLQVLTDKREHPASMTLPPRSTSWGAANASGHVSQRPYYVQRTESGNRSAGVLATPAKSTVSKFVDFVFGMWQKALFTWKVRVDEITYQCRTDQYDVKVICSRVWVSKAKFAFVGIALQPAIYES